MNTLYAGTVISNTPGINGGGSYNHGSVTISCSNVITATLSISLVSADDPLCNGDANGSIEVAALDGVTPYMYRIDGGNLQSSPVFNDLNGGTYTLEVVDNVGASASINVTLTEPTLLTGTTLQLIDNPCFGDTIGVIEIEGIGGTTSGTYMYQLNNNSIVNSGLFTGLPEGNYSIEISDDNNCTFTINETISTPIEIVIQIINQSDITCNGNLDGSFEVFADGGVGNIEYSIDNTNFQSNGLFTNLASDTYTVTVRDANNCTASTQISISEPQALTASITSNAVSCLGDMDGSLIIMASGGSPSYQYSLGNSPFQTSNLFENLIAGTYMLTVKDDKDCTFTIMGTVNEGSSITITETIIQPSCNSGGSIDISHSGQGPFIYTWSTVDGTGLNPTSEDQTGLEGGTYIVDVQDDNGCSTSMSYNLSSTSDINANSTIQNISCFGDSTGAIDLEITSGAGLYTFI